MKKTIIYSSLIRQEKIMGLPKDGLIAVFSLVMLVIISKNFYNFSIIFLLISVFISYSIVWFFVYIDPFYFSILFKKIKIKTKEYNKNKGNKYVC